MKLESIISGMFLLIMAYLVLSNAGAFNTVITSVGNFVTGTVTTLQARNSGLLNV